MIKHFCDACGIEIETPMVITFSCKDSGIDFEKDIELCEHHYRIFTGSLTDFLIPDKVKKFHGKDK